MAEQERRSTDPEHHRTGDDEVPMLGKDGQGAASVFGKNREEISKHFERFEEIMAILNAPDPSTAGSSAPPGEQQVHQVTRPARSSRPMAKEVTNERLIREFRQTSGE